MKRDIRILTHEVEKKIGKEVSAQALHKVWGYMTGKEKPSKETLDKLALFVGFQSWDDFHEALEGEDDGQLNYEIGADVEKKQKPEETVSTEN